MKIIVGEIVCCIVGFSLSLCCEVNLFLNCFRAVNCLRIICLYFHYCNIACASSYKTNLRRLVTLQKRVDQGHKEV